MSFKVLVKDGQGQEIHAGAAKTAISKAKAILRTAKANIHFMSFPKAGGGLEFFFFDATKAAQAYWLAALKRSAAELAGSGQVPQK